MLTTYFFYIFLFSLPFGYRTILYQFTTGFDEYESAFLYVTDIAMLAFLCAFVYDRLAGSRFLSRNTKSYENTKKKKIEQASQTVSTWESDLPNIARWFSEVGLPKIWPLFSPTPDVPNINISSPEHQMSQYLESAPEVGSPKYFPWLPEIRPHYIGLFFFLFFSLLSIFWAFWPLLALYNFIRLFLLVLMALAVASLLKSKILNLKSILATFAALTVFESLYGFLQFLLQRSLNLCFAWPPQSINQIYPSWAWSSNNLICPLGESVFGPQIPGTAKFFAGGGELVRSSGTLPHANILGAFLILGLIALYYFWLKRPSEKKIWSGWNVVLSDLFLGLGIFTVLIGLILTFSRSSWIIAILVSLVACSMSLFSKRWIQAIRLVFFLLVTCFMLLVAFRPFIFPRAELSVAEPSVSYRLSYNKIGLSLIKSNPFGVGIGNQVIYAVKNDVYKDAGLKKVWEWQPVHNLYLLMASEIGILGLLAFLGFLFSVILSQRRIPVGASKSDVPNIESFVPGHRTSRDLVSNISNQSDVTQSGLLQFFKHSMSKYWTFGSELEHFIPKIMLLSLLLFGLVDHFLWTLQPGRLMLWLVVGLVMGTISNKT